MSTKEIIHRPTVVCLCGSSRFFKEYQAAEFYETMAGRIYLSIGFYPNGPVQEHGQTVGITPDEKERLDVLHLAKIDLADEVLILNVGGYLGESTFREMFYAYKTGKTVRWLEPVSGETLISWERARQVNEKGYTEAHDDEHRRGQIAQAARFYELLAEGKFRPDLWPWTDYPAKNGLTPIRAYMVAGALYRAECDRLRRARMIQSASQVSLDRRRCAGKIDRLEIEARERRAWVRIAREIAVLKESTDLASRAVAAFGQAVLDASMPPPWCATPGCLRDHGHTGNHAGAGFRDGEPLRPMMKWNHPDTGYLITEVGDRQTATEVFGEYVENLWGDWTPGGLTGEIVYMTETEIENLPEFEG